MFSGDLKAGIIGAITAAAFWQIGHGVIGQRLGTATSSHGFLDGIHLKKIIAHGVVGGASAELQGGKFYQGFLSAGTTQAFSPLIGEFQFKPIRVAISGGIGGTASVLGGGKFANGALTGAFSRLFNDEEPDHANESDDHFVLDIFYGVTSAATDAVDYWIAADNPVMGTFAMTMTEEYALSTTLTLIPSAGLLRWSARPFWQYYPAGRTAYSSDYLTRGWGWKPPYSVGTEASSRLALPHYNPGTAVRAMHPKGFVGGPGVVKPANGWPGRGMEYKIGDWP